MNLLALGIGYVIVLLAALLLISELGAVGGQRRSRERSHEAYGVSRDAYNASVMGLPVDTGHGYGPSCGGGYADGGACGGGGHSG